jgi:hypothetical protein
LAAGLPALRTTPLFGTDNRASDDRLFSLFQEPPATAKPFVRWWWNGDKLSAKEILRELDVMHEAGIGGVEINPIAFPGGDDLAIPSMKWLSPEWIEMVKVALKGAEERGMVCDIIVGSGWPFGAEFMEGDERSQVMTLTSRKVKGAGEITISVEDLIKDAEPKIWSKYSGMTADIASLCLAPLQMATFKAPLWLPFDKDQKSLQITVPEGEYILYVLVKYTGFQSVINGAPGAAGPVLNHYNKQAVLKFLTRMSDTLFPQLEGMRSFRALFCDSMELEGANWCSDFTDEFKRRRGYDVTPYLPFILSRIGGMGQQVKGEEETVCAGAAQDEVARVRYDFNITCMDIMRDRFLLTYTQWCNRHGYKSRVQTYGLEFHPLEASMNIDIPECETWLGMGKKDHNMNDFIQTPAYTNVNKYVASAARLSGKKIVSCEESTNTDSVFNATLEQVKITGDQSNLSGVTHSIIHGFNYTPLEAPFPGWVRYGTFVNERNLWWSHFKKWAAYKTRISAVLQDTEPYADIAVMHPLADMWTLHGPQRDPFPQLLYPKYQYRVWEGIHHNGNGCDYTSEGIIVKSTVEDGYLKYNNRKYHTLILLEVESIMPATARALANFAAKGGKLIFVAKEPHQSPGLKDHKKNDAAVQRTIADMKRRYPSKIFTVEAPGDDAVAWFAGIQRQCGIKPYMHIDRPHAAVSQIRQRTGGKDIFFVSNCSLNERVVLQASFPESTGTPSLWNAETGERHRYPAAAGNTLTIDLPPATSQLIVFDTQRGVQDMPALPAETTGTELRGWSLRMEHINGTALERTIDGGFDLSEDETTRGFAGHLYYEKEISIPDACHWLDLGKVHGISEVTLNGAPLGSHWYGRHLYRLPEGAAGGTLRIKNTTTLGNYFKANPESKPAHDWTGWQQWQSEGIIGPVKLL